ncbi:MAG: metallophosphoesterase [Deltaproteobacteria bacterium]|nr:metallophosphoesterase [Deltaproteobacteria bacterium]
MFEIPFRSYRLTPISIEIRNLPTAFHGFRILQLSDLHIDAKTSTSALYRLVDRVNEEQTDIVVITGDLIDEPALRIRDKLEVFKQLELPTYFVSGNHDLYRGLPALRSVLPELGIIDLDNRHIQLKRDEEVLNLVGISDRMSRFFNIERDVDAVFEKIDPEESTILLAHQPKDIRHAHPLNVDLQLSGHTHGGQIYPFHHLVKLDQPFVSGHHRVDNTQLFISRGIGTWGIRLRFRANSEIPVLKLQSLAS